MKGQFFDVIAFLQTGIEKDGKRENEKLGKLRFVFDVVDEIHFFFPPYVFGIALGIIANNLSNVKTFFDFFTVK